MAALSEWLQLMLAEIARKRDDLDLARAEEAKRATEIQPTSPPAAQQPRAARA
jgi:hypothetical protein